MATTIRLCMLNADYPVPNVYAQKGPTYGHIFDQLLVAAAQKNPSHSITITSVDFDVVKGEYPTAIAVFDALIVSGSANSAYDDLEWIRTLGTFLEHTYHHEPQVKIFGSCFGHQIVCQSLLKSHGVTVEADPKGWELGVKEIKLTPHFRKTLGKNGGSIQDDAEDLPETMRLQFVHHDHVVIPSADAFPPSWITLGSTAHCAVQGVYEPGRVLTLQGHFEFDRFINSETVKFFFPTWEPQLMKETLEAVDADDDAIQAADMVLKFFMEKGESKGATTHGVVGGLLTPP